MFNMKFILKAMKDLTSNEESVLLDDFLSNSDILTEYEFNMLKETKNVQIALLYVESYPLPVAYSIIFPCKFFYDYLYERYIDQENGCIIRNLEVNEWEQNKRIGTYMINEIKKIYNDIVVDATYHSVRFWKKQGFKFMYPSEDEENYRKMNSQKLYPMLFTSSKS